MDSKIGFEMSLIVVEAIRGRCASFMILTVTVSEIFGRQTNSSILVVSNIYILGEACSSDRTDKLCVQYFKLVVNIRLFVIERHGD